MIKYPALYCLNPEQTYDLLYATNINEYLIEWLNKNYNNFPVNSVERDNTGLMFFDRFTPFNNLWCSDYSTKIYNFYKYLSTSLHYYESWFNGFGLIDSERFYYGQAIAKVPKFNFKIKKNIYLKNNTDNSAYVTYLERSYDESVFINYCNRSLEVYDKKLLVIPGNTGYTIKSNNILIGSMVVSNDKGELLNDDFIPESLRYSQLDSLLEKLLEIIDASMPRLNLCVQSIDYNIICTSKIIDVNKQTEDIKNSLDFKETPGERPDIVTKRITPTSNVGLVISEVAGALVEYLLQKGVNWVYEYLQDSENEEINDKYLHQHSYDIEWSSLVLQNTPENYYHSALIYANNDYWSSGEIIKEPIGKNIYLKQYDLFLEYFLVNEYKISQRQELTCNTVEVPKYGCDEDKQAFILTNDRFLLNIKNKIRNNNSNFIFNHNNNSGIHTPKLGYKNNGEEINNLWLESSNHIDIQQSKTFYNQFIPHYSYNWRYAIPVFNSDNWFTIQGGWLDKIDSNLYANYNGFPYDFSSILLGIVGKNRGIVQSRVEPYIRQFDILTDISLVYGEYTHFNEITFDAITNTANIVNQLTINPNFKELSKYEFFRGYEIPNTIFDVVSGTWNPGTEPLNFKEGFFYTRATKNINFYWGISLYDVTGANSSTFNVDKVYVKNHRSTITTNLNVNENYNDFYNENYKAQILTYIDTILIPHFYSENNIEVNLMIDSNRIKEIHTCLSAGNYSSNKIDPTNPNQRTLGRLIDLMGKWVGLDFDDNGSILDRQPTKHKTKPEKLFEENPVIITDEGDAVKQIYLTSAHKVDVRETINPFDNDLVPVDKEYVEVYSLSQYLNLLKQDLEKILVDKIASSLGFKEFPITVPKSLTQPEPTTLEKIGSAILGNDDDYQKIDSIPEFLSWLTMQLDDLTGEYPIKIKIKDSDLLKEGNQELNLEFQNQAETLTEMIGLLLEQKSKTDILINTTFRNLQETGSSRKTTILNTYNLRAIHDYLGFKIKYEFTEMPFTFNPLYGQDLNVNAGLNDTEKQEEEKRLKTEADRYFEKALEPTKIKIKYATFDITDKQSKTLEQQLFTIGDAVMKILGHFWQKLPKTVEDFKKELKDKINFNAQNKVDLDSYLEQVENAYNLADTTPYDKPKENRPKIISKKITKSKTKKQIEKNNPVPENARKPVDPIKTEGIK